MNEKHFFALKGCMTNCHVCTTVKHLFVDKLFGVFYICRLLN